MRCCSVDLQLSAYYCVPGYQASNTSPLETIHHLHVVEVERSIKTSAAAATAQSGARSQCVRAGAQQHLRMGSVSARLQLQEREACGRFFFPLSLL
jgi:hypothetical protein